MQDKGAREVQKGSVVEVFLPAGLYMGVVVDVKESNLMIPGVGRGQRAKPSVKIQLTEFEIATDGDVLNRVFVIGQADLAKMGGTEPEEGGKPQ